MKHNFEERKENRISFALAQASKNTVLSQNKYVLAYKMASFIPMGQPILIGHHSEKRDRNYRKKIDSLHSQSYHLGEKAKYYEEKAVTIESNPAIFSDDPEALIKLREKRALL